MEPTPPLPGNGSPLRFHPRGPPPLPLSTSRNSTETTYESLSLLTSHNQQHQQQPRRQHHHHPNAKLSPRHVKLQRVGLPLALPVYASTVIRDPIHNQFRHELFQFHQLLQDAAASSCSTGTKKGDLSYEIQSSTAVFHVLTSDRHTAMLREFFLQWQRIQKPTQTPSSPVNLDEQEMLSRIVDTIFRHLPMVLTEEDVRNAKAFVRYMDALRELKELVVSLLFKSPELQDDQDEGDENEKEKQHGGPVAHSMATPLFASTAALLAAVAGSSGQPPKQQTAVPAHSAPAKRRVPLYLYCHQLQQELDSLRRKLGNLKLLEHARKKDDLDVGLLNDQTVTLLLEFWELPKSERLAFFCQVASQAKDVDCDSVLRVFLEKCSLDNLLSVWDALQLTPHVQHAIAVRKHGDDADAAAREAAEAMALASATQENEEKKLKRGSGDDDGSDSSNSDGHGHGHGRGKHHHGHGHNHLTPTVRSGHRHTRHVDLNGFAGGFEDNERHGEDDGEEDEDHEDQWGNKKAGKRRRHRLRMRDQRGRSPDTHSHDGRHGKHHQHGDKRHARDKHNDDDDDGRSRPDSSSKLLSPKPKPILDRVHSDLLELLKVDDSELDETTSTAAWKLIEAIDKSSKRPTGSPQRKLSTFQSLAKPPPSTPPFAGNGKQSSTTRSSRKLIDDPLGSSLTTEQQYTMRLDQLQSLLTSLGSYSLLTMSADTITSAYKRIPVLHRLFREISEKTYSAVGLDPPKSPSSSVATAKRQSQVTIQPTATAHTTRQAPAAALPAATAAAPPAQWTDDLVMDSVEAMLAKLGKMVRTLAPMADVGQGPQGISVASAEILKLAEAMEEIAKSTRGTGTASGNSSEQQRRGLSLDHSKRLAMLNRLKSLAQGTQIESLTGLLATTCDEIVTLKAVADHQQHQLQLFTGTTPPERAAVGRGRGAAAARFQATGRLVDDNGDGGDNSGRVSEDEESGGGSFAGVDTGGANDGGGGALDAVIKNIKKAKIRRASAAKTAASIGKTDDTTGHSDDDGNDADDDHSLLMNPMTAPRYANRDIPLTIKQATAPQRGGNKLFNVGILLRVVDQMYREHYEAMVSSLQYGSRRMEFSEFMYDWHIRKYGLKTLAQQHLLKLIQSLRKYERKAPPCHLCLQFLGIVSPLGYHEHKFVLGLLDKWSGGTFSGASKHRVEHTPRQFKIRISFAITTIQEALSDRFGVYFRTMEAVTLRIKALSLHHDEEFIKESDVVAIALDEWQAQRQRIEQILEAVYTAGDLNGDGSLEYDEFSAVMFHLSPSLDEKFVHKVFTAAHDYLKPRRISFARFLDVVLLERVLNTSASSSSSSGKSRAAAAAASAGAGPGGAGAGGASGAGAGSSSTPAEPVRALSFDSEETYQFTLLEKAWESDKESVAQVLRGITHQQTVASIQFRVAFLTQILSKKVDSKTAWMCHRQIMREISKYHDLNEDQIVAVQKKEETFKKAVLAIRNLQKLGVMLSKAPQASSSSDATATTEGGPTVSTATTGSSLHKQPSYLSVVENALSVASSSSPSSSSSSQSGLTRPPSTLAEMQALEDEIRQKFLDQADETAIDDYKVALQTIRRMSRQAFSLDEVESMKMATELYDRQQQEVAFDQVMEEEEDKEDEEEEEEEGDDEFEEDGADQDEES